MLTRHNEARADLFFVLNISSSLGGAGNTAAGITSNLTCRIGDKRSTGKLLFVADQ